MINDIEAKWDEWIPDAFSICFASLNADFPYSAEDIKDAVTEAFLRVRESKAPDDFDDIGRFIVYLKRASRSVLLNSLRRENRYDQLLCEPGIETSEATSEATVDELKDAIDSLGKDKRNILVLYYFRGLSDRLIAEALGFKNFREANRRRHESIRDLEKHLLKADIDPSLWLAALSFLPTED